MRIGSLFSGYSGLDMAVEAITGATPAWFVEFEEAPSKVLAAHYPNVPNFGDITKVDWAGVPAVDVLTGGFPCQDVSLAGARKGIKDGTRSGLWSYFAEAIRVLQPSLVVIENVHGLLSAKADSGVEWCPWCMGERGTFSPLRALGAVLGDLAEMGFDAEWGSVRASDIGAPHRRERVFIIAYTDRERIRGWFGSSGEGESTQLDNQVGCADFGDERSNVRLFPTPTASDVFTDKLKSSQQKPGSMHSVTLPQAVQLLPTPSTIDGKPVDVANQMQTRNSPSLQSIAGLLGMPAELWPDTDMTGNAERQNGEGAKRRALLPTPLSSNKGASSVEVAAGNPRRRLEAEIALLPTPNTMDGLPAREGEALDRAMHRNDGRENATTITNLRERVVADLLPTPTAVDGNTVAQSEFDAGNPKRRLKAITAETDWGKYEPAIKRWEQVIGRKAPQPTEPSKAGKQQLSSLFVEWMMGLPSGWVTGQGLTRNQELKMLGNGVVPQQAFVAVSHLLERI